jgi:hypothetical protein
MLIDRALQRNRHASLNLAITPGTNCPVALTMPASMRKSLA